MKIAIDMAAKIDEVMSGDYRHSGCVGEYDSNIESIISNMLEPVRDAIYEHLVGDCGDTRGLRDVIVMFEEVVKK